MFMKKFFSLLMSVAVLFSVTSCSQEDITTSIADGNEVLVTLTTTLASVDTRAVYGNGDNVDKLIYNVYDAQNGDLLTNLSGTATATAPGKFTVQLKMLKGMKYHFVFWAQNEDCDAYTVNEDKTVKVDYTKIVANDDTADAFFGYVPNFDPVTATSTTFKLYRPFAQLNAATNDYDVLTQSGVTDLTSTVTLKTYNTFDISTGDVTGNVVDVVFKEATDIPTVDFHKPGYTYLSMNYVLAAKNQNITNTHFTFTGKKSGNDVVIAGTSYANIPLQQNFRTNILGALLTKTTDFTVEIVPAFDDTEHDVDAVNVSNTIQLLNAINNAVNGHSTVINLDNNIDLNTSRTRAVDSGLEIPAGKVIVLNLNGYILSYENNNAGASMIYNLGTLTIGDSSENNDGHLKFTTTATDASLITNEGALKIDGDTFDSTETIENVGDATVEAVGGTFTDLSYLTSISNGADVTINLEEDVTITKAIAISAANANVTINGNDNTITYTGSDRVIDVRKEGVGTNLTINNLIVDVTSGYSERGINYNTNGQLNLNNVTVQGAGITYAVNLPGMSDNAVVTINNSNLAGCIALNVWGENAVVNAENTVFTSIDTTEVENYAAVSLCSDGNSSAEGAHINIVGGSITAEDENGNPSVATRNGTVTGVITVSDTTTVVGDHKIIDAIVFYGSAPQFYGCFSLQQAIDKAIKDQAIPNVGVRLTKNLTLTESVVVEKGAVTLDMNGHTLSYAVNNSGKATAIFNIKSTGILNVVNNATAESKITFTASDPDLQEIPAYATNTISNDGTLTIGAKVVVENHSDGGASYAIDNRGKFTLNGGSLLGNRCALRVAKFNQDNVQFTMNDGLVTAKTPAWIHLTGSDANVAPTITVEINNGTFQSTKVSSADNNVLYTYSFGNSHANTTVNISGGKFLGGTVSIGSGYKGDAPTLNITGGTFEYDVLQWNADGSATVIKEANK